MSTNSLHLVTAPSAVSAAVRRQFERYKHVVALDPGKTTGCAIYHRSDHAIEGRTLDFWGAVKLSGEFDPAVTLIVIEDPRLNGFTYGRHTSRNAVRAVQKISRNVGMNQQDAARLAEHFEGEGFAVRLVQPAGAKWTAKTCQRLTGYDGKPQNQHVRDAIRLLFQEGII